MMRQRCLLPLIVLVAAAACRSTAPSVQQARPAAPAPTAAAVQPTPTPVPVKLPEALLWARTSAEHRGLFLQIYRQATEQVERQAAALAPGTWAVVLDADETVIDNSLYEVERIERHLPFDSAGWHEWTKRRQAVPLPGAAAFLARVHALGGKIAIVTNRTDSECTDTGAVFRAHDLPFDVMLCKPDAGGSDKNPRFEAVANGTTPAHLPPLTIVAFLGDNIQDFPHLTQAVNKQGDDAFEGFGTRFFLFPNPVYGSWD